MKNLANSKKRHRSAAAAALFPSGSSCFPLEPVVDPSSSTTTSAATDYDPTSNDGDDDYEDWMEGNWCWLLSPGAISLLTDITTGKDTNCHNQRANNDHEYDYHDWREGNWCWVLIQKSNNAAAATSRGVATRSSKRRRLDDCFSDEEDNTRNGSNVAPYPEDESPKKKMSKLAIGYYNERWMKMFQIFFVQRKHTTLHMFLANVTMQIAN